MSLRYALLGLLAETPQTGYDLTQKFGKVLSRYAWSASHSQVYPELRKMTEDGLVTLVGEGARGSRTYAVTAEGRSRLRAWLMRPPEEAPARNEFVLRLFLLTALEPAEAAAMVKQLTLESEREIEVLRAAVAKPEAESGWYRYAAEFGIRWYTMQRDWAEWVTGEVANELPRAAAPPDPE
ncbi:PadR family transcriptional regulator [Actinoplanes sp. NPDC049265]|uniref:PadR family transcriptional regulator n=1 Tax=Actinoplanes sp. NPDC049265 TaxID=3363902 RepID=UPI003711EADF